MPKPVLVPVTDTKTNANFREVSKAFDEACPVIHGALTDDIDLVVGENLIKPPRRVRAPSGKIIIYQSAAADITDNGLNASGYWSLTSTAVCTVRLLFL